MNKNSYHLNAIPLHTLGASVKTMMKKTLRKTQSTLKIQSRIAQLVEYRLGTGEVPGSNPGKGENFSMSIDHRRWSKKMNSTRSTNIKKNSLLKHYSVTSFL